MSAAPKGFAGTPLLPPPACCSSAWESSLPAAGALTTVPCLTLQIFYSEEDMRRTKRKEKLEPAEALTALPQRAGRRHKHRLTTLPTKTTTMAPEAQEAFCGTSASEDLAEPPDTWVAPVLGHPVFRTMGVTLLVSLSILGSCSLSMAQRQKCHHPKWPRSL